MFKKICCLLITIITVFALHVNIYAENLSVGQNTDYSYEIKAAELFLQSINHSSKVSNAVPLYNIDNKLEAICFDINNGGYIIVNVNDLSIPELSLLNESPFGGEKQIYAYNGPLQYYKYRSERLENLHSKKVVAREEILTKYTREFVDKENKIKSMSSIQIMHVNQEEYLNNSLRTWYISGGFCGPIAGAICLMYYDDNINDDYVDSDYENKNDLITIMNAWMDEDESGGTIKEEVEDGLNYYFDYFNINNFVSSYNFSFNRVKSNINNNKPVIVGTYKDNDTQVGSQFGNHWIIAHGYFNSSVDGNYIIVNDGYGRNNVWVSPDDYLDYIITFNE